MTIALGFQSRDGIALCTDSQVTKEGGLKFNSKKIEVLLYENRVVAFAYAGSPEVWPLFLEEMQKKIEDESASLLGLLWHEEIRAHLETVLISIAKKHRDKVFEVLCAASHHTNGRQLYYGTGKLVREAQWECLGVGDSSVVRYLSSVLHYPVTSVMQCLFLGYYIVDQAKQFTDRCGGPTQGLIVTDDGNLRTPNFDEVDFHDVEQALSFLLWTVSNPHSKEEQINEGFKRFEDCVREIKWNDLEII